MSKTKIVLTIGGWIVAIIIAFIGGGKYKEQNMQVSSSGTQAQSQSITIVVDGQEVTLNKSNAQNIYQEIADKVIVAEANMTELQSQVDSLEKDNDALATENEKYQSFGMDALVSKNKNYDSTKVSLLAFDPVNSEEWKSNQGSLKDSLGNNYSVTLPYLIMNNATYGEFYLNGEYKTLEFKLAPHEDMNNGTEAQIKVYADDIMVFASPNISRKTELQTFKVDIGNAKFVKITCERVVGSYSSAVLFLDSTLIK